MKKFLSLPRLPKAWTSLAVALCVGGCPLPALHSQTVAIDRQGNVQNATVKFDGTIHTIWVDGVEISGAAMTDARTPLAHAASHASAGSDPLTLAITQITGLVTALAGKADITEPIASTHAARTDNPHATTKTQVGLGNADNTSDLAKPVSTATQTALDLKVDENGTITGATKTKITYDAKGLVTSGTDATTADVADSTDKRYVTDAQRTVIQNTSGTNTGDQTITLTGDVTGSGTGSFAATISADAVSLAKMADMATASFLGRNTAATGDPEVLSIATAKTMLNLSGTNTGDQTSIVGITGTIAQFNTALSDGDFATGGGTATGTNTGDQDLSGYQTKAGVLAFGGFSSITGRIGDANLPLGSQLYDNAGTPILAANFATRQLLADDGATVMLRWDNNDGILLGTGGIFSSDSGTWFDNTGFHGNGSNLTGIGTVTSFSASDLSPLFTTSEATVTTTPALTFALSNAAAHTIFGNFTGSSGAPSYNALGTGVDTFLGTPTLTNFNAALSDADVATLGANTFTGAQILSSTLSVTGTSAFGDIAIFGVSTTVPSLDSGSANIVLGSNQTLLGQPNTLGAGGALYFSQNASFTPTANWKYISTDLAVNYYQYGGEHVFRTAPSGTAGNVITWATPLTISGSGATIGAGTAIKNIRHGTSGALVAGSVTVTDTGCTANTRYFFTVHTLGTITVPMSYYASTRTASTSFVITSADATDTSTIDWMAVEP